MRHRWAIVRRSMHLVTVQVHGSIFYVTYPQNRVAGPFRRHDTRFRLLPNGWQP